MASGHVSRIERPNTWPHRPRLHARRFFLPTRSRPHTGVKQPRPWLDRAAVIDPSRHFATVN
jgi:hypothetical protein